MSPKLSAEELKKAKEQKRKEREEFERERLEKKRQKSQLRLRWEQISSELDGLYLELDKIYRKAPEEQISDLTLINANNLIRDTKGIVQNDLYIDRIKEFIAAGDNPEYRDVIMVLRQLREGLNRFRKTYFPNPESLSNLVIDLDSED
jgi:Rps23 Pro-64 3,4-dihydroxylase Tpa1-like proline 4-hydroxylase